MDIGGSSVNQLLMEALRSEEAWLIATPNDAPLAIIQVRAMGVATCSSEFCPRTGGVCHV